MPFPSSLIPSFDPVRRSAEVTQQWGADALPTLAALRAGWGSMLRDSASSKTLRASAGLGRIRMAGQTGGAGSRPLRFHHHLLLRLAQRREKVVHLGDLRLLSGDDVLR